MGPKDLNTLKWVAGGLEALLGIPILGGTIILSLAWAPLAIMLVLHIVIVVFASRNGVKASGNILGIVTSCIGWIPIVGMILHILSAIFILLDAAQNQKAMTY
ncbi:hypothetical protein [Bacillus massiliigorillae]|uniref:hypothetical protein n=1 Tax=Bacillus massiliigorillae TaxID=1243664 RepID=UPI00039F712B|nr:hypothetical protein [Bacillus massiliigorillae]